VGVEVPGDDDWGGGASSHYPLHQSQSLLGERAIPQIRRDVHLDHNDVPHLTATNPFPAFRKVQGMGSVARLQVIADLPVESTVQQELPGGTL